jgi:hypothetical protein
MTWKQQTADRWADECMGMDAEETLIESLRLATAMMEAALLMPEWGWGFIRAARSGDTEGMVIAPESQLAARELAEMFPVEAVLA